MSSVWCQVVMPDGITMGNVVKIAPVPIDINDLCEVVKVKMDPLLKDYAPIQLIVFPPGTTDLTNETKAYKRWISCPGAAAQTPLIVVAPQKESGTCVVVLP